MFYVDRLPLFKCSPRSSVYMHCHGDLCAEAASWYNLFFRFNAGDSCAARERHCIGPRIVWSNRAWFAVRDGRAACKAKAAE